MKIYVGNVTVDTSLKLTKEEAEKLGQLLLPYKDIKMTIYDCIVKIENWTIDTCHKGFNLITFIKNLNKNADTLVKLINKYLALNQLIDVDFYSLDKYREEMANLIYSVKPSDPFRFASLNDCSCVERRTGTIFVETDHPIDVVSYRYKGLKLYLPENLPGNYSCFVKEVGEAFDQAGFELAVEGDRIYYYTEDKKALIYSMPSKQFISLEYLLPFLYKLANDESFREKFIQIADKIAEAEKKRGALASSYFEVRRKIELLIYKSAGVELNYEES